MFVDITIRRIIQKVASEFGLEPGFLLRIVELEEENAYLSRRHRLSKELIELSRESAQRELNKQNTRLKVSNEDQNT